MKSREIIKSVTNNMSIDNLKKIVESCGKSHIAIINQESLKVLKERLSTEEYDKFYNKLKD